MQLLLGTNNPGKVIEIREVLAGLPLDILTPQLLNIKESPDENAETFSENAKQKASFYSDRTKLPTLADDSGIIVDALKDELGIHTRRWGAGPTASDEEWIAYFLKRMKKEKNKRARFACALAYIDAAGAELLFEGFCEGTITDALEADYLPGLPISACFRPDGFDKVFSALSVEEKNRVSHRGKAAHQFAAHLRQA